MQAKVIMGFKITVEYPNLIYVTCITSTLHKFKFEIKLNPLL